MKNSEIIMHERIRLMNAGLLDGSGEIVKVIEEDGTIRELEIPEEIHTFAVWKELGYSVKKGEHALAKITIWKYAESKNEEGENETDLTHAYMKTSFFFKKSQVQEIAK